MKRLIIPIWLLTLSAGPLAQAVVRELPPIGGAEQSRVYEVTAGGKAMIAQRCDGRVGPASYVHLIMSEPTEFTIRSPQAQGEWGVYGIEPVEFQTTEDSARFTLDAPAKLVIRTAAKERLFIFADVPENAPQVGSTGVISIADRGVDGKGSKVVTARIQEAIDELAARPHGGTLVFPPGLYRTGTIRMRSNVTVHLSAGARLQGSEDPKDYPFDPGTEERPDRTQEIRSRLVLFDGVENAAIEGLGEIDGAGHIIRGRHKRVPNLIRVRRSRGIRIEGVLLRRAAGWNTHIFHSDSVTVRNVKSFSNWSDGIDPDNSRHVTIEDVLIDSYDDSCAVKATFFTEPAEVVRDITLRDAVLCTVKTAVKIGTETQAKRMEDITFENVTVAGSRDAIGIFLRDGAVGKDVKYDGMRIFNSDQAIKWSLFKRHGASRLEDVLVANITVAEPIPSGMKGLDAEHQIQNVRFVNFRRDGRIATNAKEAGLRIREFVSDVQFVGQ